MLAIHWRTSRAYCRVVIGRFRPRRPLKRTSPGLLYRLPGIPRCGRVIRQAYHVWGIDDASILFSQRTGGGGAAAPGTARERACLPAGSDDREHARGMEPEEAARLAGLSRSAAYEWHNRYEEDGIEGLRDRPRPGRQPRADAVPRAAV